MDPQQCFDTYVLTIPTMLAVTGLGVSIGLAVRYLKTVHPITFNNDGYRTARTYQRALDRIEIRNLFHLLGLVLGIAGALVSLTLIIPRVLELS